jgi:hypothetical protein
VGKLASDGFDPKAFLSKVGAGKTILEFENNQHIFEQETRQMLFSTYKRATSNSLSYPSTVRKQ